MRRQTPEKAEPKPCTFTLTGTVDSVYNGKKYDYCTLHVQRDSDYYDLIKVTAEKGLGIEEGDKLSISGRVTSFFDREKKVNIYTFFAETVLEVD